MTNLKRLWRHVFPSRSDGRSERAGGRAIGRCFDSFNQEGIDNRRTIRITLRLTF